MEELEAPHLPHHHCHYLLHHSTFHRHTTWFHLIHEIWDEIFAIFNCSA
jgi:hypothetical protein